MKYKISLSLLFAGALAMATLTLNSCKKEETFAAPTIALSGGTFTGKIGQIASVTATVTAPGGLKSLKITKYKGTDVDATYGTAGTLTVATAPHTLNYELTAEGLTTPIRFKFEAEDNQGQKGSADFIITTEPSVAYLLTTYDWLWKSKLGKCLSTEAETEQILACEKDNFYSFKADGTYTVNFGAITGTGGGTCDFDGFVTPTTWSLNANETELTINGVNAFDPNDKRSEVYKISSATVSAIKSKQTIDLSAFGCIVYDWGFEWSAKPK